MDVCFIYRWPQKKLSRALTLSAGHSHFSIIAIEVQWVCFFFDAAAVSQFTPCLTSHFFAIEKPDENGKKYVTIQSFLMKRIFFNWILNGPNRTICSKMQSSRSNVCKHRRKLFCKPLTMSGLGYARTTTKNWSEFYALSAKEWYGKAARERGSVR